MRVAVFTYFDKKFGPLADITLPVLQRYCKKNGYFNIIETEEDYYGHRFQFTKTIMARRLLDHYDVFMAMDIDTLITNQDIRVEDFLDSRHDIYITNDINNINLGVFIVMASDFSKGVLDFVNSQKRTYIDEQNVFERNVFDKTKICKHPCFNSIPYQYYAPSYGYIEWDKMKTPPSLPTHEQGCWQPGDFIMHLPGMPLERRIEIFTETLKNIYYD